MLNDLEYQYAIRSEIRNVIREQLPLIPEKFLVEDINSTASMMAQNVVQARWSEETGAHKLIVRPEMLKSDGSTSQLNFLSSEEVLEKLNGSVEAEFESSLGCKRST